MLWLTASLALAHNPHDPVLLLGVSPDFETSGAMLAARTPAQNWRPEEIVRSDDGGVLWEPATNGLAVTGPMTGLQLSPDYDIDGTAMVTTKLGAWATSNGGLSWTSAGLEGALLLDVAVADGPSGPRFLVAEGDGSLWWSDDLGTSWTEAPVPLGAQPAVDASGTTVSAVSDTTLWTSDDAGDTWQSVGLASPALSVGVTPNGVTYVGTLLGAAVVSGGIPTPLPGSTAPVEAIGIHPDWPAEAVLVLAEVENAVLQVSEDGGATFAGRDMRVLLSDQAPGRHVNGIQIVPTSSGEQIFVHMFEGLRWSTDRGLTWTQSDTRPPHLITGLALSEDFGADGVVYVGTYDGGAYLSQDGGDSFEVRNLGLLRPNVYDTWVIPGGELWIATLGYLARGEVATEGYTLDEMWQGGVYPTQLAVSPDYPADGYALVGTRGDGVLRTTDYGASWTPVAPHTAQVTSVAISDDPSFGLSAGRNGAVRGTGDGGSTWFDLPQFPQNTAPSFVASGGGVYLVGTVDGLYETDDSGVVTPIPEVTGPVEQVAVAADGTRFAVLRGGPVMRSDPGQPFVDLGLADGLIPHEVTPSPDFATDDIVFASTGTALLRSDDRGATWQRIDVDPVRYEESSQAVLPEVVPALSIAVPDASARTVMVVPEGSSVTLTFYGTGVTWLGATGGGLADVEIDGALFQQVDTAGTGVGSTPFVEIRDLLPQEHTLTVRPVAGTGDVYVDAFDVTRVVSATTPPVDTSDTGVPPTDDTGPTGTTTDGTTATDGPGVDDKDGEGGGCGCVTPTGGAPWGVLAVLALVARRRR